MSDLEKIVYLADKIEPGKNYQGIEEERRLAYQNLDKAVEVRVQKRDEPNVDIIKLQYNAFSYAYDLSNMENSDANTKVVTYALYQYWKMAQQYVEENKNA